MTQTTGIVPPRLTIERIETIPLRVPLDTVYRGSHYKMTHRSTVITRVHTAEGIVGEAYVGDEDHALQEIRDIVDTEIAPAVIGQDAFATERIWELGQPVTRDILRDRRVSLVALAGVDTAVWDAVGKALGAPLWKLWGGYRSSIPVISIGGYYRADADIAREVGHLRDEGFAGMKFKIGGLSPAEDADRVRQALAAAGDDFRIAVDANQGWSAAQAIEFSRIIGPERLLWFEEPCHWEYDRRAMRDVRLASGIAVCAGQSEWSAAACRELMELGAIDYCNFDSSWSGGPTEWRRAAATAHTYGVRMAHHEEPQIASHLLASIPHGTYLEFFSPERDPIWHNLIANRPRLEGGMLSLTDAPGLGWELDADYIERYRTDREGARV
ncbi:mandelate racemase/muconate lactonizing enzyme family protein [Schumannella luteola]